MNHNFFIDNNTFRLKDFSGLYGPEFIRAAYAAVLKREPDPQGFNDYLEKFRKGRLTRAQILAGLRFSHEGRANKVRIRNLIFPLVLDTLSSLPLIRFSASFFRLLPRAPKILQLFQALENNLAPAERNKALAGLARQEYDLPEKVYLALENEFRGSPEQMRSRLQSYLPILEEAKPLTSPVIDLGSGRGEWLKLLQENNIPALGVDLSRTMVLHCLDQNLNAVQADALDYLAGQADNSQHAITSFQLMEHMQPASLVRLWQEAFRVLKPGGFILFETPNPENYQVSCYYFFLDPTHQKPIPPPLATYTLHALGFRDIKVIRSNEFERPIFEDPRLNNFFCSAMDYAVLAFKP